jgi:hypothetical protein
LGVLQQRGADVALICEESQPARSHTDHADPSDAEPAGVPLRAVRRIRPLAVIRALEVERQVRIVDAVVLFGRRAQLMRRFLPRTLRPELPGLDPHTDPERAFELIEDAISR